MRGQEFDTLSSGTPSLLELVEEAVVDAHRRLYVAQGRAWSRPLAYRWLRYEDPVPVDRLIEGLRRLVEGGGTIEASVVDKACDKASEVGFSN